MHDGVRVGRGRAPGSLSMIMRAGGSPGPDAPGPHADRRDSRDRSQLMRSASGGTAGDRGNPRYLRIRFRLASAVAAPLPAVSAAFVTGSSLRWLVGDAVGIALGELQHEHDDHERDGEAEQQLGRLIMRDHVAQHRQQHHGGQRLQQRVKPEPQGVHIQVLVPWLVSSLVANGLRMIMKSQAMLSVRNRESIHLAYRKMSWWWLHAAAITRKLIRNAA